MRTPQPERRDTDVADQPGMSTKRRRPRLRSRKARFGALGVLAVGVTGGLLAASALAAPTPAPPSTALKVLLISSPPNASCPDATTAAWEAALKAEGVPFDEVYATNTGTCTSPNLGSWNVPLPALTTGTQGNYNGVIIADSPSDFTPGQLSALDTYEGQYHVRQLDGYVTGFPAISPSQGFTNDTTGTAVTATSEALTAAGTSALPGLAGTIPFDTGSYAYPATVTNATSFTSWLSYGGATSLGGVYQHASTDAQSNVQEASLFFAYNQNQTQWHVLAPALINWVTQNTHLGLFRNYVSLNLDDMFNSDNTWDTLTHTTSLTAAAQMTGADIVAAAQWSRLNNFRIDWAFNGGASASNTSAELAQLTANDPATGKPYTDDFGWINHTWDHATLDEGCATQNYIEAEINQNAAFATQATGSGGLGLTADPTGTANNGYGTFDVHSFVPGEHSGLANLIPGVGASIDPVTSTATAGASGSGTLAAGAYNYAVTAQYISGVGDSQTSAVPATVAANGSVTLNWTGICKAASYKVYRQDPGSATWGLIANIPAPATTTIAQSSTTTTPVGGDMAPLTYTDTGATETATTFVPSVTLSTALEYPYEQNQYFNTAMTALGITSVGGRRVQAIPEPADDALRDQHDHPVHRGRVPGRPVVCRRDRAGRPAPPDQHLLQRVDLAGRDRRVQHDLRHHHQHPGEHHRSGRLGDVQHDHQQRPGPVLRAPDQHGRRIDQRVGDPAGAHPAGDRVQPDVQLG